tara:strand:+ start:440 stop:727 length:288 start_codon:yes stop_codon:yes gene_type:complete
MPEVTSEVPTPSITNGKISVPIGAVFMLISGGVGAAAGGGANFFNSGITAEQVATIVDDRLESKDEVLDIKLQTINEKLARIEGKLDQIQITNSP